MPSLLSCSLSLNLLALWANNTTVSCCNLWTILNIKLNNTELNDTLWNFNNRPHNGVQMPCLLHPLAELPPFSLTLKVNPIDDPSTIMNLLQTSLHTTFQYTTRHSIKAKIRYQTPERPTWDEKEPDLRSWWWQGTMWEMLGGLSTRTPKTSSKAIVVHHKNYDPPPLRIPFSCCLSGTNANSHNTQ